MMNEWKYSKGGTGGYNSYTAKDFMILKISPKKWQLFRWDPNAPMETSGDICNFDEGASPVGHYIPKNCSETKLYFQTLKSAKLTAECDMHADQTIARSTRNQKLRVLETARAHIIS